MKTAFSAVLASAILVISFSSFAGQVYLSDIKKGELVVDRGLKALVGKAKAEFCETAARGAAAAYGQVIFSISSCVSSKKVEVRELPDQSLYLLIKAPSEYGNRTLTIYQRFEVEEKTLAFVGGLRIDGLDGE